MNGVIQVVSGKMRLLVVFQDGSEKGLTSNQLTALVVNSIPVTEEVKLPTISVIPDETIDLDKVYYPGLYVIIKFDK